MEKQTHYVKAEIQKMAADQKLNIRLVKEIENYPYIYNFTLPEYARRDVTERAWIEIGQKVHLSGPECKEKWKNLRSVFARRLKRRRAGKAEKRPYYLAEYMQFTLPFLKMNSNLSEKLPHCQPEEMSDSEREKNCNETDEDDIALSSLRYRPMIATKPSPNSTYILPSEPSPSLSDHNSQTMSFETSDATFSKNTMQIKISDISDTGKKINDSKNKEKCKANQLEQKSNRMFLLSLLADMDAMDDKQRRFFKQKMLEVVDDIFNTQTPED